MYEFGRLLIVILLAIAMGIRRLLLHNRHIYWLGLLDRLAPGDVFGDAHQSHKSQDL